MRRLLLIALALVTSPPMWAKESPAQAVKASPPSIPLPPVPASLSPLPIVTPTEEAKALALELATLLNSEDLTRRQLAKAYTETMPKVLANNQQFRVMEFQYPGISAVAINAEREIVEPSTITILPGIQGALANAISAHITAPELRELLAFYSSPLGTKILDGIAEGTDMSSLAQKRIDGDDNGITADDLKTATSTAAMPNILKSLTKEDIQQVVRFEMSPLGKKWKRMGPLMLSTAAEYQNNNMTELKAKAQENVMIAVVQYMRDHPSTAPSK